MILPRNHTYGNFEFDYELLNCRNYRQDINSTSQATGIGLNNDYDLFFYMYQMNAQNAIDTYQKNTPPDSLTGDFSLMLF